jgi:hypothetical protein
MNAAETTKNRGDIRIASRPMQGLRIVHSDLSRFTASNSVGS